MPNWNDWFSGSMNYVYTPTADVRTSTNGNWVRYYTSHGDYEWVPSFESISDEDADKMAEYFKKQEEERKRLELEKKKYPLFFIKPGIV